VASHVVRIGVDNCQCVQAGAALRRSTLDVAFHAGA
jgi:hypothetical protein